MKKFLSILVFLLSSTLFSQENQKILYADISGSGTWGKGGGFTSTIGVNYQYKKHLFTARILNSAALNVDTITFGEVIPLPFINVDSETNEYSILYGKRYINDGFSFSFSLGISYMDYKETNTTNHLGFPVEFNIKWFKSKKKPYRILWLIPVGDDTGFGKSIGFKFLGNISKTPYAGIGITVGFGYHKKYN